MDNLDRHLINQVICYCIEQIVTNNLGLKMMTMRIEVKQPPLLLQFCQRN